MTYGKLSYEVKEQAYNAVCKSCSFNEFLVVTGLEDCKESYSSYAALRQRAKRHGVIELRAKKCVEKDNGALSVERVSEELSQAQHEDGNEEQPECNTESADKKHRIVSLDIRLANNHDFRAAKNHAQSQLESLDKEISLLRKNIATVQNKLKCLIDERDKVQKQFDAFVISEYIIKTMTGTL